MAMHAGSGGTLGGGGAGVAGSRSGGAAGVAGSHSGGAGGVAGSGNGAGGSSDAGGTSSGGARAFDAGSDGGPVSPHPDASTSDGAAHDARMHPKRLFITHDHWDGNLKDDAGTAGIYVTTGIAAADVFCNYAANGAGLGGVWVAWLSDSAHDALDRVRDVGPWYRVDGAMVFPNKAALVGNPLVEIDLDEHGDDTELIPDGGGLANVPWTGTLADGTRSPSTCNDWTSNGADVHGLAGANTATTNAKWSEGTVPLCNNPYHLYCFEQ
jgi:hypothetical protein